MKLTRRRLALAGAALLLGGGAWAARRLISPQHQALLPDPGLLAPGDWFFRRTNSLPGYLSRQADPTGVFSHVGIVGRAPGGWMVIHATPADVDGAGGVRADPVSRFTEQADVTAIAVARCVSATPAQRQNMAAAAFGFVGRPFDGLFDSEDEGALYCTELVWRATSAAGISLDRPLRPFMSPLGTRAVVSLTTLVQQPGLDWVVRRRIENDGYPWLQDVS